MTTSRKAPLHVASALTMLAGDWLLYAWNVTSELDFRATTSLGALLVGSLVGGIERRSCSAQASFLKATAAAVLVAFPMPVLGAVGGLVAVTWALMNGGLEQRSRARS